MGQIAERQSSRDFGHWLGAAVAIVPALGYLAGYLQVLFFSSALGLTARDLDLNLRDYLVLAFINALTIAVGAALYLAASDLEGGIPSPRREWLIGQSPHPGVRRLRTALVEGIRVVLFGAITALSISSGWGARAAFLVVGAVGIGALVGLRSWAQRRWVAVTAGLFLIAVFVGTAAYASDRYGQELRAHIAQNPSHAPPPPPLPLRSVLQPERGFVAVPDASASECAVRVADRVVVGRRAVVVTTISRFTRVSCRIVEIPFAHQQTGGPTPLN